jgi:flavin-dependent dehydrogenase
MPNTDVLVIGAGPAGAAAALALQRHAGLAACLVEGSRFEHARIGESVTGALRPLMRQLDAEHLLRAPFAIPSHATESAWGDAGIDTRDSIFSPFGGGMHLDRRAFDEALAALFESRGGTLLRGAWLRRVARVDGGWRVTVAQDGAERALSARFVIDATGRRAAFARRAGAHVARFDALVAVTAHVARPPRVTMARSVLVEAVEDGWWYSAPLPRDRAVVAFLTDADLLARAGARAADALAARLPLALHTAARLRGCGAPAAARVHLADSRVLVPPVGDGWVAAGDAAFAHDPLSSAGIGHALASGMQAARIAHEHLQGGDELAHAYPCDVAANLQSYLVQRAGCYATQQRWPGSAFWRRRRAGVDPAEREEARFAAAG